MVEAKSASRGFEKDLRKQVITTEDEVGKNAAASYEEKNSISCGQTVDNLDSSSGKKRRA